MATADAMTGDIERREAERKAKLAEKMRRWRAANPQTPEEKAKAAVRYQKWRQENKERYNLYRKAWRVANREKSEKQDGD
ncbi:hypothetical protein J2X72_005158 [Phyllobacterium sp. 1468]|uniref:hypothetical protein n=1 Tax=Phyllobacterium sp. 1468 TaxID=2817759 RepID=UPI00285C2C71|nr:hypothetical protein [Phyllobacterium sp. 1468]MDR6636342.1 hypothetical protein [Phyllobacterium sp. 1468]